MQERRPKKILVTGVSGFVGRKLLVELLEKDEFCVRQVLRAPNLSSSPDVFFIDDLTSDINWVEALRDVDCVIHLAARAHKKDRSSLTKINLFDETNVQATINLANQAATIGVKRFIFMSSIGVNGTYSKSPFTETDVPNPTEAYAISKLNAENGLWDIQHQTGMEIVIIRPPLVYGPEAPGNFGSLARLVSTGLPLPLGSIRNKRTLIGLDNLVDLVITCINHPNAGNQVFVAGDDQDVSTTELLEIMAAAMKRPSRLMFFPVPLLLLGAALLGKKIVAERLVGSLQVDASKAKELLSWEPPYSLKDGIARSVINAR